MQKTTPLLIKYIGSTSKQSIPAAFQAATNKASDEIEKKYPKVQDAKIQGSEPHKSSKDASDPKEVITISYHTAKGTRVTSVHVHNDATYKEFPSRNAVKGKVTEGATDLANGQKSGEAALFRESTPPKLHLTRSGDCLFITTLRRDRLLAIDGSKQDCSLATR